MDFEDAGEQVSAAMAAGALAALYCTDENIFPRFAEWLVLQGVENISDVSPQFLLAAVKILRTLLVDVQSELLVSKTEAFLQGMGDGD